MRLRAFIYIIICIIILIFLSTSKRKLLKYKSYIIKREFYDICEFPELEQFNRHFKELKAEFIKTSKNINNAPRCDRYGAGDQYKTETVESR